MLTCKILHGCSLYLSYIAPSNEGQGCLGKRYQFHLGNSSRFVCPRFLANRTVVYLLLMVIGYYVYGDSLKSNETIFQTIEEFPQFFNFNPCIFIWASNALVVIHLLTDTLI